MRHLRYIGLLAGIAFALAVGGTAGAVESTTPQAECATLAAGTWILKGDGTQKHIEKLKAGDAVRGEHGINHVTGVTSRVSSESLYGFNSGGWLFATAGQYFHTQDGWKVVAPPSEASALRTGDTLSLPKGAMLPVTSIDGGDASCGSVKLYGLLLDGDHSFYANGYLVRSQPAFCRK